MSMEKMFLLNINILNKSTQVITSFRKQNIYRGTKIFQELIQNIQSLLPNLLGDNSFFNVDNEYILSILKSLFNAQENSDYILLADLLELQFTPFLLNLQNIIREREDFSYQKNFYASNLNILKKQGSDLVVQLEKNRVNFTEKYSIEQTSVGSLTVKANLQESSFYLHSN